ncbi:uncharacterized protein LOC135390130 [Ornithodoros turicata]|uniref:uncharacterized protein LOC135390130 n=1 Tax=Ornithodoros turicata TaxID=34597 RepID=UPI003139D5E2
MFQVPLALVITIVLLCSSFTGLLTSASERKEAEVTAPAHVRRHTLDAEKPGLHEASMWKRDITTHTMSDSDPTAEDKDGPSHVHRRATLSPQVLTHAVLGIEETMKTLSQTVQRLSDDVINEKASILAVLNTFKEESMKWLSSVASVPGLLQDLSQRFDEFEKTANEKLVTIEASLFGHDKLLHQVIQESQMTSRRLSLFSEQHTLRFNGVETILRRNFRKIGNVSAELGNIIPRRVDDFVQEGISRKLELAGTASFNNTLREIRRMESSIETIKIQLEQKNSTEKLRIIGSSYPTAFFHVEGITEHIEKMNASKNTACIQSEPYVINGYTAKLELSVTDKKDIVWLGTFFLLCRGSGNSLLQWPFRTKFVLSIFHPKEPTKDIHKTVTRELFQHCPGFDKPDTKCRGCGFGEVLSYKSAKTEGYLLDDAITVGVTLFPEVIPASENTQSVDTPRKISPFFRLF